MGLFDTVYADCPNCGEEKGLEFQSKGGDCMLANYMLENAPLDVLSDVNRHSPSHCRNCKAAYTVKYDIMNLRLIRAGWDEDMIEPHGDDKTFRQEGE